MDRSGVLQSLSFPSPRELATSRLFNEHVPTFQPHGIVLEPRKPQAFYAHRQPGVDPWGDPVLNSRPSPEFLRSKTRRLGHTPATQTQNVSSSGLKSLNVVCDRKGVYFILEDATRISTLLIEHENVGRPTKLDAPSSLELIVDE
jgi:hypothetical protein